MGDWANRGGLSLSFEFQPALPNGIKNQSFTVCLLLRAEEHPGIGTLDLAESAVEGHDEKERYPYYRGWCSASARSDNNVNTPKPRPTAMETAPPPAPRLSD